MENEYGFVGIASELVRYDRRYDGVFQNLLGRTVVVEDLDCGITMARRYQNRFRIVTLDGQVINRGRLHDRRQRQPQRRCPVPCQRAAAAAQDSWSSCVAQLAGRRPPGAGDGQP